MGLALDPERWQTADLADLVASQHNGLTQILDASTQGIVPIPSAFNGEVASGLLRAITDLGKSGAKPPDGTLLVLIANLQYQSMLAVSALVPSTLVQDRAAKKRESTQRDPQRQAQWSASGPTCGGLSSFLALPYR